jgi:hypothetical protein
MVQKTRPWGGTLTVVVVVIVVAVVTCLSNITFRKNNTNCYTIQSPISPQFSQNLHFDVYSKQFRDNNLVHIKDVFREEYFHILQNEIATILRSKSTHRNHLFSGIRKAETLTASDLMSSKIIADLYYSSLFIDFLKKIALLNLETVNCDDQSSMNLLVYNKPDDFIAWHHDPNHYTGKRLTILISIVNTNSSGTALSSSQLEYKDTRGEIHSIQMAANSILVFNGSLVEHRATGISDGDSRIVLSFTYCDECRETFFGNLWKRLKETVLY